MMFGEEDEDFDPLKRSSGSVKKRTGSLSSKPVPPTIKSPQAPLMPSPATPTAVGGGDSLLGDLSGLDLSADAPSANSVATTSVQSLQEMLKPLQTSTMPTSQPLLTSTTPLSSATPITQPAQIQVWMLYLFNRFIKSPIFTFTDDGATGWNGGCANGRGLPGRCSLWSGWNDAATPLNVRCTWACIHTTGM